MFDQNNVRHIEVKVINGNPTIHLNEKHGFRDMALAGGLVKAMY